MAIIRTEELNHIYWPHVHKSAKLLLALSLMRKQNILPQFIYNGEFSAVVVFTIDFHSRWAAAWLYLIIHDDNK